MSVTGVARRLRRARDLSRLTRDPHPAGAAIATAIRSSLVGARTHEEQAWIDRIESLRSTLNASTARIFRTDYGAGSPGAERTAEEMRAGVETADTVGHFCRSASKPPFWCGLLFDLIRRSTGRDGWSRSRAPRRSPPWPWSTAGNWASATSRS